MYVAHGRVYFAEQTRSSRAGAAQSVPAQSDPVPTVLCCGRRAYCLFFSKSAKVTWARSRGVNPPSRRESSAFVRTTPFSITELFTRVGALACRRKSRSKGRAQMLSSLAACSGRGMNNSCCVLQPGRVFLSLGAAEKRVLEDCSRGRMCSFFSKHCRSEEHGGRPTARSSCRLFAVQDSWV